MLRRDFISFIVGALVAGPRVAIAQTTAKVYRVGTLLPGAPVDEKSPLGVILLKKLDSTATHSAKTSRSRSAPQVARSASLARLSTA